MERPCLLVIDMLQDFLDRWEPAARQRLIDRTNELVRLVRRHDGPVVWVRQEFEPDLSDAFAEMRAKNIRVTIRGTPGCQIVPELRVQPADRMLIKKRYSAFFQTPLDEWLADLSPDALILAGINTHACVRATAIDAYQRDRQVILAADCIDSYDREHHDVSLRYLKDRIAAVMSNAEIAAQLDHRAPP